MSTLKVTNIQATGETVSRAVSGVAGAWFSSYDAGTTADSVNISSSTDNGTGDGTYSFTNNFASVNYAVVSGSAWRRSQYHTSVAVGSIRYYTVEPNASETTLVDYATDGGVTSASFGDLA